jgi:hypothetical protein
VGGAIPIDTSVAQTLNPAITSVSNGGLFVTYTNEILVTDWQIEGKTVSSTGVVGPPVIIFDNSSQNDHSELATLANGNIVAVWDSRDDGLLHDVFVTVRTPTGAQVTAPARVPIQAGDSNLTVPHVAALADGGFVVVWNEDANNNGIRAELFDANGHGQTGSILVNNTQAGVQLSQDVAALPDGGFIVAWEDITANNDKAQRFDAAGNKVGAEFIFNDHATADINVAALADGRSIFTVSHQVRINDIDVESSIWDTRITDAITRRGQTSLVRVVGRATCS